MGNLWNIDENEIFVFIDKPFIPSTKARYVYDNKLDKRHLAEGAWFTVLNLFKFSIDKPAIGRFGHKIFFKPHPKAFDRLTDREAYMEYALHFVSSKKDDPDTRIFDVSKFKVLGRLEAIITEADGYYNTPDGVNYYKKIFDNKRSHCVLVMKLNGIGQEGVYRVSGMMPNKKEDYIKKAIQRIA